MTMTVLEVAAVNPHPNPIPRHNKLFKIKPISLQGEVLETRYAIVQLIVDY
jgi:hypothetical protein